MVYSVVSAELVLGHLYHRSLAVHLRVDHVGVQAVLLHQALMGAQLGHDPVRHHRNLFSILDRRQPVRDRDGSAALAGCVKRLLHNALWSVS